MFFKYPSIENFQNFLKTYKLKRSFIGLDENNQPIFEEKELPEVVLTGTVKIHGTNAGVTVNQDGSMYIQKRSDSMPLDITKGGAHFGFMQFVYDNQSWFINMRRHILSKFKQFPEYTSLTFFGEWAGPGIQKNVGISQIDKKRFFIFGIQEQFNETWLPLSEIEYNEFNERIWFMPMFKKYTLRANFNAAAILLEQLDAITLEVENECPVAKEFGISGIGEGVVWTGVDSEGRFICFKHKGEKHQAKSREPKEPKEKAEKAENSNVTEFINSVDIINRLQQCYHEKYENIVPGKQETGKVLSWVFDDIIKEEYHLLSELNLQVSEVKSDLMNAIRLLFFKDIDNSL